MNPCLGRKVVARNISAYPDPVRVIPDIPLGAIIEITLRPPSPSCPAEGLVHIEFEGLWSVADVDVEVHIQGKMAHTRSTAQRVPVERIRIGMGSTRQAEFRRR